MDGRDTLSQYRKLFYFPKGVHGGDSLYLCGHSLGLQPRSARDCIDEVLADWAAFGVGGHFQGSHPWASYQELLAEATARLVGAKPLEVATMNSLTVNLHLMMASFYQPATSRHKIMMESKAFPSDQYAVKSCLQKQGLDPASSLIELMPRAGEETLRDEDILSRIAEHGQSLALILLGGVNYLTGQLFDIPAIVKAGRQQGCIVGFDLAHAVGNVVLKLHDWDLDFAVWCGYKYLNGGPGSVAGCFVHERHAHDSNRPRLAGWWGNDKSTRFNMENDVKLMAGADGWQLSTPPMLLLAALRASLEIFDRAGIENLRSKSVLLTGYLEFLLSRGCRGQFSIITPDDPSRRGAQISIRVPNLKPDFSDKLALAGAVCDFRGPDILRISPAPLYNSFHDVHRVVRLFLETVEKTLSPSVFDK
jgi:kynureninase